MSECDSIPSTPSNDEVDIQPLIRIGINWAGLLEPVDVSPHTEMQELAYHIQSANDCSSPEHKLFIYKGMLLPDDMSLEEAGIKEGSVLHLVLDDCPYQGRALHVNCQGETLKTIFCGADFYIEDVKEDLSYFLDQPPPEMQNVLFAGRELQNYHTLREYNIQKESVLMSVSRQSGREVINFLDGVWPERDCCDAALDVVMQIRLCSESANNTNFWGSMLGGLDTDTIDGSNFTVKACTETGWSKVSGIIQIDGRLISFIPSHPLLPATRYEVSLRGDDTSHPTISSRGTSRKQKAADDSDQRTMIMHSKVCERVQGQYTWSFCTVGYEPLRIVGIYPRPYSRVRGSSAVVVLRFSRPLTQKDHHGAADWITVRGHALQPPAYDADACALVYSFAPGAEPQPGEICRAHVHADRVRGAGAESLFPVQPDGLLRTSTLRWKFYADAESRYERENLAASGVAGVLARHAVGRLRPMPAARGSDESAPLPPRAGTLGGGGGGRIKGQDGRNTPWGIGVPALRNMLGRPDGHAAAEAAEAGAYPEWLNPSKVLADAFDAFYCEEIHPVE